MRTGTLNITIDTDDLIDAVVQADEFGEGVKTVIHESIEEIMEMFNQHDFFICDEFTEAVGSAIDREVKGLVEDAVNDLDLSDRITDAVKDEMPDYSSEIGDLDEKIEDIQNQLDGYDDLVRTVDILTRDLADAVAENDELSARLSQLTIIVQTMEEIEKNRLSNRIKNFFTKNRDSVSKEWRKIYG